MAEIRIAGKFRLERRLGNGAFGEIYLGTCLHSRKDEKGERPKVAIKLEPITTKTPQLIAEAKVYKNFAGGVGVPKIYWYGTEGEYNVMVMDVLGASLEDEFRFCRKKLSVKTCLMIADQVITRMEFLHSRGFLHRDIKPENFMTGVGKGSNVVYVIDFGLCKAYVDPDTKRHIGYSENNGITGTVRFVSINTHKGIEQSRRDDLEAVGYMLMYLNRGSLPWQGVRAQSHAEKERLIGEAKMANPPELLCKHFPDEFAEYFRYCNALSFDQKPNYGQLRKMFKELYIKKCYAYDDAFDWVILRSYPSKKSVVSKDEEAGGDKKS